MLMMGIAVAREIVIADTRCLFSRHGPLDGYRSVRVAVAGKVAAR